MITTAHQERLRSLLTTIFDTPDARRALTYIVNRSLRSPWFGEPLTVALHDKSRTTPVSDHIDHLDWGPDLGLKLLCGRYVVAGVGADGFVDSTIRIRQIQGVKSGADVLCRLPWQRSLCLCLMTAAKAGGYETALITPARRQRFYPLGEDAESEAIRQRMKRHYDQTALALGFHWSELRECFVRKLK